MSTMQELDLTYCVYDSSHHSEAKTHMGHLMKDDADARTLVIGAALVVAVGVIVSIAGDSSHKREIAEQRAESTAVSSRPVLNFNQ